MKKLILTLAALVINTNSYAKEYKDSDVLELFNKASIDGQISTQEANQIYKAARNPHSPVNEHAGGKFLEALSWYNDVTLGNRDERFTLTELEVAFEQELKKYLGLIVNKADATTRMASWKMLQKLKILEKVILKSRRTYYAYNSKKLSQVSWDNDWNKRNTITTLDDFNHRVLRGSWDRPVLVKFGLTYCVHCLLMENLGSVPALAKRYGNSLSVYKLWWNPKDPGEFSELNQIAHEQGVKSSPIFNLYYRGRLIKSAYAFPDENGLGMEDYFSGILR